MAKKLKKAEAEAAGGSAEGAPAADDVVDTAPEKGKKKKDSAKKALAVEEKASSTKKVRPSPPLARSSTCAKHHSIIPLHSFLPRSGGEEGAADVFRLTQELISPRRHPPRSSMREYRSTLRTSIIWWISSQREFTSRTMKLATRGTCVPPSALGAAARQCGMQSSRTHHPDIEHLPPLRSATARRRARGQRQSK